MLHQLLLVLIFHPLLSPELEGTSQPRVENLEAFSRLYGYLRFFFPGDESEDLDWNALAVHGVRQVLDVGSGQSLKTTLHELFSPIVPGLRLDSGYLPIADSELSNLNTQEVISWQHRGYGPGSPDPTVYQSVRTNRIDHKRGEIHAYVPGPLSGKLTLSMSIRADASIKAGLFLIVSKGSDLRRIEAKLEPINDKWQTIRLEEHLPGNINYMDMGLSYQGEAVVEIDHIRLTQNGESVALEEHDFESPTGALYQFHSAKAGYQIQRVNRNDAANGSWVLSVVPVEKIFQSQPPAGKTLSRHIGRGLVATFPLSLPDVQEEHHEINPKLTALRDQLKALEIKPGDPALIISHVVIVWNVFQHFYPYFDVLAIDWSRLLPTYLAEALTNKGEPTRFLMKMVSPLGDAHSRVDGPTRLKLHALPARFAYVEDQVVVSASADARLKPGDIVLAVDGQATRDIITEKMVYRSGRPSWSRHLLLYWFGASETESPAKVLIKRGQQRLTLEIPRGPWKSLKPFDHPPLEKLPGGYFYLNMHKLPKQVWFQRVQELSRAKGLILDLRGHLGNGNIDILHHMCDAPVVSPFFDVPLITHPDRQDLGWETSTWTKQPMAPRFRGKIIILADHRNLSYDESFLSIVKHHGLATIVGSPTAGANDQVNHIDLPGGYRIKWTGSRVRSQDGSPHHMVGIRPDIEILPTVDGIRQGRDEILEKAISLLAGQDVE